MNEVMKVKVHFNGYDNSNRPLLMVYAERHNPKESSLEMLIKFTCFIIETAVKRFVCLSCLVCYFGLFLPLFT